MIRDEELPAASRAAKAERAGLTSGSFDLTGWLLAARAEIEAGVDVEERRGEAARAWIDLQAAAAFPAVAEEEAPR